MRRPQTLFAPSKLGIYAANLVLFLGEDGMKR
jgi:hypothetical protein